MKNNDVLLDNDAVILELTQNRLAHKGYQINVAASGDKILKNARSKSFDLIVLDLILPDSDVLDVAKALKKKDKTKKPSIVMLTANGEESDVVTDLLLSADEYITKPYNLSILVGRIRAALRRKTSEVINETSIITINGLEIHPREHSVVAKGMQINLTYTEFQLLYLLARRPGRVYSRSQIVFEIHGSGYPVTDRSVDVQIVSLRKKLGAFGKHIETVRGVGYRFRKNP